MTPGNLTVNEIEVIRRNVECSIRDLLKRFEEDTLVAVTGVTLKRIHTLGQRHPQVNDVRLEVVL